MLWQLRGRERADKSEESAEASEKMIRRVEKTNWSRVPKTVIAGRMHCLKLLRRGNQGRTRLNDWTDKRRRRENGQLF